MSSWSEEAVYLNFPFGEAYRPRRNALLLSVVASGFYPLSAIDVASIDEERMDRIFDGISNAARSIHDVSRCPSECATLTHVRNTVAQAGGSTAELPRTCPTLRWNVVFELGVAIAAKYQRRRSGVASHRPYVIGDAHDVTMAELSNLRAFDVDVYAGTEGVVRKVVRWLGAARSPAVATTGAPTAVPKQVDWQTVVRLLPRFETAVGDIDDNTMDQWDDWVRLAKTMMRDWESGRSF